MTDGNIQPARTKLADAVRGLTAPQTTQHNTRYLAAPSLYHQLCDDLAGTQGDTRTPAKSLPPLWIDAAQLKNDIDTQTQHWSPSPGDTPHRLRILTHKTWRPQDTDLVTDMARTIDDWTRKIVGLLHPESQKTIDAPCPRCGRKTVHRKDSAGDIVRQPALRLVANIGCTCQHCQAFWPPEKYMFLQKLLGLSTEGVIPQ